MRIRTLFIAALAGLIAALAGLIAAAGAGATPRPVVFGAPIALTGYQPFKVVAGDLNGDGILDLVSANATGTVSVLLGNGSGAFQARRDVTTSGAVSSVAIGDVNLDGKPDLVVTESTLGST